MVLVHLGQLVAGVEVAVKSLHMPTIGKMMIIQMHLVQLVLVMTPLLAVRFLFQIILLQTFPAQVAEPRAIFC